MARFLTARDMNDERPRKTPSLWIVRGPDDRTFKVRPVLPAPMPQTTAYN